MVRAVFLRRLRRILVSTSPPAASFAALFIRFFRRVPVTFWAMDINPDQLIAMGQTDPNSLPARLLDASNRKILSKARGVVALDRFMGERLEAKTTLAGRLAVMPPWPHESHLEPVDHADNPFREEHELQDKFVLMYSGNISPAHPVDTFLEAARRMQDDPRIVFLFIGGGTGKRAIDQFIATHDLGNLRTLPYQPLERLKYSLSAADVHLVVMGNEMVGIVHPCKVYGAMTVARPVLLLGPRRSHIGELLDEDHFGWQIDHGDVDAAVAKIQAIYATDPAKRAVMGQAGRSAIRNRLSMEALCGRFCDVVEWNGI